MKKLLALGSVVGGLILMGAGCYNTQPAANNQPDNYTRVPESTDSSQTTTKPIINFKAPPTLAPSAEGAKPQAAASFAFINISNFSFSEPKLVVKAGTTVKWTNKDQVPHNIVSADGSFSNSSVGTVFNADGEFTNYSSLNNGDSYQVTFDKPGTYDYSCGLHPTMHGQIIVQ